MTNTPVFSIIVPVYNAGKYLSKCIESIISQSYTDFELLLIDDGSQDNSGAVCDEYAGKDARIRVFHKKNGGVSSARNKGIEEAKGEWITFVDSDDWLAADFLERMLDEALKSNADAVFCNCFYVYADKNVEEIRYIENSVEAGADILKRFLIHFGMRSELWGKIIRRKYLSSQQLREDIKIGEDLLYLMELYYRNDCRTAIVTDFLYYYRQVNSSAMKSSNLFHHNKILLQEYLRFTQLHPDIPEKYPQENAVFIIRVLMSSLKSDVYQYKDTFIKDLVKKNFDKAGKKLQRNEKRLIYLLYIHPLLARMERICMKYLFENKNRKLAAYAQNASDLKNV